MKTQNIKPKGRSKDHMKTYLDAKKLKEGRSVVFLDARMFEMNDTQTLSASELRKEEKKFRLFFSVTLDKRERISEVRAFKRKILKMVVQSSHHFVNRRETPGTWKELLETTGHFHFLY